MLGGGRWAVGGGVIDGGWWMVDGGWWMVDEWGGILTLVSVGHLFLVFLAPIPATSSSSSSFFISPSPSYQPPSASHFLTVHDLSHPITQTERGRTTNPRKDWSIIFTPWLPIG